MLAHLRNPRLLATYAVGFGVLFNFIATFTYLSFHLAAPPFNHSPAFLGSIFVVYLVGVGGVALARPRHRLVRPAQLRALRAGGVGRRHAVQPDPVGLRRSCSRLVIASTCGILVQASSTSFVAITAKTGTSAAVGLYVTSFYIGGTFGGWLPAPCLRGRRLALFARAGDRHAVDHGADRGNVLEAIDDDAGPAEGPEPDQPGVQHPAAQARHVPDQPRFRAA